MGITNEDRAGLDKSLKELNLSTDEMDKFSKAFKDPEFLKLFEEYAKEVSDPKVKEETDMYLRQLEFEGRMEEVYGKGAQLILPTPAFVVKTQDIPSGAKVFINICTSDKLDKACLKSSVGPRGQKGSHFDMPLCLGPKKEGQDKAGGAAEVWDFVVHPDTLGMAGTMPAIKKTLVETAMEKIEETNAGHKLHRQYREPKMKYKTTEGCTKPHSLAMRGSGSESINGRVKPVTSPMPPAAPPKGAAPPAPQSQRQAPPAPAAEAEAEAEDAGAADASRSKFAFPGAKPGAKPTAAAAAAEVVKAPSAAGYVHPGGEVTPEWEVVHRGQIDLTDAWGDAGRGIAINTTHPKELVIRILLPGLTSAASAQLDVSRNDLSVHVPGKYLLQALLPFPVNSDLGKAKFDKAKQQLQVTVPVVPPPLPAAAHAPAAAAHQAITPDCVVAAAASEEEEAAAAGEVAVAAADAEGRAAEQQQVDSGSRASDPDPAAQPTAAAAEVSENQRRWAEMHVAPSPPDDAPDSPPTPAPAAASQEPAVAAGEAGASEEFEFKPAVGFEGGKAGYVFRTGPLGLGYYRDVAAVSVSVSKAAAAGPPQQQQQQQQAAAAEGMRAVRLQPRLTPDLVADLD